MFVHAEPRFAVDIPPSQVNILDGNVKDLVAECNAYEDRIKAAGGIELFLAGIGEDGHIAFNEPGKLVVVHMFHLVRK
jgi:glucosamine-6-phosphate deaminase